MNRECAIISLYPAGVAQGLEQAAHNRLVVGSNPTARTKVCLSPDSAVWFLCYNKTMSEFKTKLRKAQYWLKNDLFTFERVVLFVAAGCCLAWTWGSIDAMSRNWTLAQELMSRQREKAILELEVETLELENEYYQSHEYQELAARKYQGKMLSGETMIYLPDNSEAALSKHKTTNTDTDTNIATATMSNLEQWLAFLFGA